MRSPWLLCRRCRSAQGQAWDAGGHRSRWLTLRAPALRNLWVCCSFGRADLDTPRRIDAPKYRFTPRPNPSALTPWLLGGSARARRPVPLTAISQPIVFKASRSQTCPRLMLKRVGYEPAITKRDTGAAQCAIDARTGVDLDFGSRGKPREFSRCAVLKHSTRTARQTNCDQFAALGNTYTP